AFDPFFCSPVDHRTQILSRDDLAGFLTYLSNNVIYRSDGDHSGSRHTTLTRAPAHRRHYIRGRHGGLGIGQYQKVVLGSAECKTAFEMLGGPPVNDLRHFGGADEGDCVDTGVVADSLHDGAVAVDNIENAVRQTRLAQQQGSTGAG